MPPTKDFEQSSTPTRKLVGKELIEIIITNEEEWEKAYNNLEKAMNNFKGNRKQLAQKFNPLLDTLIKSGLYINAKEMVKHLK